MTRDQVIDILKNGTRSEEFCKNVYVSFGQLPPEVQELARMIGRTNFEIMRQRGFFGRCTDNHFCDGEILRLRSDYEDKPQEPEYDERPVTLENKFHLCNGMYLVGVADHKNFAGYRYADGMVGTSPVRLKSSPETNKPLDIEHPVSVLFRKDKA
jgi:hypothetical protein